jgi:hypothetical protein
MVKRWAFFRFIRGERLTPLIKANLDALCRRKRRLKGRSTTKQGTPLKNQIPVRVFWAWDEKKAGFCEIAMTEGAQSTTSRQSREVVVLIRYWSRVAYPAAEPRGIKPSPRISPHYAWTLTVTGAALGWTEARALKNKAQKWTLEAADDIAASR